jgi:CRISPR-associated protein Csm3
MPQIAEFGRATATAQLKLLSGLHIGAGKDSVEIGGIDNPVVKHPHTGEPYIPGSSVKGRVRYLLEWALGKVRQDGAPWGSRDDKENERNEITDPILRIFGNALKEWKGGPTRLLLRDAPLQDAWRKRTVAAGLPLTEEKTEVVIDRIQGKALDRVGPRQTERVPAGASFDFAFTFRLYGVDGDEGRGDIACLNWWLAGLGLLEQEALGGSGSRGYGRIAFEGLTLRWQEREYPLEGRFRLNRFPPASEPPSIWAP